MVPGEQASSREIAFSAVGGRLAFVVAVGLLLYAIFFHLPRLFVSTHVTHFAGFFVFSFAWAAAAKRVPLLVLGAYAGLTALAVEAARAVFWLPLTTAYLDGIGDLAGVVAALAPMLLQKIRSEFAARPIVPPGRPQPR